MPRESVPALLPLKAPGTGDPGRQSQSTMSPQSSYPHQFNQKLGNVTSKSPAGCFSFTVPGYISSISQLEIHSLCLSLYQSA